MTGIMIRGIYTTSLAKLALDSGFEIVNPTWTQSQRFNLDLAPKTPDLVVEESRHRHGISLVGHEEGLHDFLEAVRGKLPDVALWSLGERRGVVYPLEGRGNDTHEDRSGSIGMETDLVDQVGAEAEIPSLSKRKLDEIREGVAYTVPGHHFCRAGSEAMSNLVTFAEKIVLEGHADGKNVSELFESLISDFAPKRGEIVDVEHVKLGGRVITLASGRVIRRGKGRVVLKRTFARPGTYDGLGTPKEPGDYALTSVTRGEWFTASQYYSIRRKYKGAYYSICTPVELYENHVRYLDLGIDVVDPPDDDVRIIDEEDLQRAYQREIISEWLKDRAIEEARKLQGKILAGDKSIQTL